MSKRIKKDYESRLYQKIIDCYHRSIEFQKEDISMGKILTFLMKLYTKRKKDTLIITNCIILTLSLYDESNPPDFLHDLGTDFKDLTAFQKGSLNSMLKREFLSN